MLLAGGAAAVRGQSALDGFDPNANGYVHVVVVQPDGKILLGGEFTTLSPNGGVPVARNHIARLNPNGTLDIAFNPNANDNVYSIAVQADGKILAGGYFTHIGGQMRNRIARLDATTGLADSFDPNAASGFSSWAISTLVIQADGKILVGGGFTGIGGQTRKYIARLDATTALADSFNPNPNNSVSAIAVQADGKILAGGFFTSIGGQTRNRVARLNAPTGAADSFNPNANNAVFSIAVQADGKILAGGGFTSIGGQTRNRIARLDATTGVADSFDPNSNNEVLSIAVQTDGKVLAGGWFSNIGGQTRQGIARLDATTGVADSFNANGSGIVFSLAVQADGKILAGGGFNSLDGQPRNCIARLETDGRVDQTLKLSAVGGYVLATAVQPDGKILIGGSFTAVLGVPRNNIARLNTGGRLDTAFDPNANSIVSAIALQADGKILVGGDFNGANSIGGQTRNRIARLNPTTGLADSFDPNANGGVFSITVQADGKIFAGGGFTSIGGQTRNRITRLDATTGLADSFNPNANNWVLSIAVQPDGKVFAGGQFSGANSIGGQTRNRIARLDAATGLADSFNPNANSDVYSIAVQADGKILAGGQFNGANSIGGQTRNFIARLDPTTGLTDSFDPDANGDVNAIAMQADGKILAGGPFDAIGGQYRSLFARLSNDTAALQDLAVTQTTITWTRGGSSPQFTRVTFEASTDNVNYTPLGNGRPVENHWTLTGLNLPTGQNIYIRARGYYRSGFFNGSESTTESVRNGPAAIPTPTPTATPTPIPTPTPTPSGTPSPTPTGTATPTATVTPSCGITYFSENFDGVIAPLLPAGWVASFTPGPANCTPTGTCALGTDWATNASTSHTAPNSAFHDDPGCVTDSSLDTPSFFIRAGGAPPFVTFVQDYNLESGFDGGVLEISIGGGAFTDIVAAGGSGANYNGTISPTFLSPISGRPAWTGNSGGYIATRVNLPAAAMGQNVVLRFRLATDCSVAGTGWRVDTITYREPIQCPGPTPTPASGTPTPTATPTASPIPILTPTPTVTPTPTTTPTPTGTPAPTPTSTPAAQAINLSTRMRVQTGDNVGIGGFIITGTAPKHVLLRAIGPSLTQFGVPNALADPVLELHGPGAFATITNNNWRQTQEAEIQATGIPPTNDFESAIDATLAPGAYTAIVRGNGNTTGIALIEVYDLSQAVLAKLANISTRAFVSTGDSIVIAGFMLGNDSGNDRIVVRGIGPSLTAFGVSNALANPTLELRDGNGALLVANNDWQDNLAQAAELTAAGLAPTNNLESGIAATLPPGLYTALLAGVNNGTGIGLVEVYDRGAL